MSLCFIFNQGGKFDHADRLFQSIEGTYKNCLSNTSDVKELIPEFFYMPEFLMNSNSYHFGVKQDGEPIGDVSLPAWAKVCLNLRVTFSFSFYILFSRNYVVFEPNVWWLLTTFENLFRYGVLGYHNSDEDLDNCCFDFNFCFMSF